MPLFNSRLRRIDMGGRNLLGGPGATVLVADNFTVGADGNIEGRTTPTGGKTWTTVAGAWIANTANGNLAVTTQDGNLIQLDAGVADCIAEVDVAPGVGFNCALVFRYVNSTNFWYWQLQQTGTLNLYRVTAGSHSQRRTTSGNPTSGKLAVSLNGSAIQPYFDGAAVGAVITDTTHQTATRFGFRLGGSGVASGTWDNFAVTAL